MLAPSLLDLLLSACDHVKSKYEHSLVENDIALRDFRILVSLARSGRTMTIAALADALEMDRKAIARSLAGLERKGFLSLDRRNPRRTRAKLLPHGAAATIRALETCAAAERCLRETLGPDLPGLLIGLRALDRRNQHVGQVTDPPRGERENIGQVTDPPRGE